MDIAFNAAKRAKTLRERGLDFADAAVVFAGLHTVKPDDRFNYGEPRFVSIGGLRNRVVVLVWTERGLARRIISMRYANGREAQTWRREDEQSRLG